MEQEKVTEELVRQNGNQAAAVMADYAAQSGGDYEQELEALRTELFGTRIMEYSPDKVYGQSDYVIYQNAFWLCLVDGTTGIWDMSKWAPLFGLEVSISSNFVSLQQVLAAINTTPRNYDVTLGNLASNDVPAVELQSGDGFETTAFIDVTKIGLNRMFLNLVGQVTIKGLFSIDGNGKVAFEDAEDTSILPRTSYVLQTGGATVMLFGDREGQYLELTCAATAINATCIIEYRGINYKSVGS